MGRWVTGVFVLMLGLSSLAAAGRAQEEGWKRGFREHRPHWGGPHLPAMPDNDRVKTALGLTDEQTDRLRQVFVEAEKSRVKTRAELRVRQIELRELLRPDQPNREAVMKKVQEISDLRGQLMKERVDSLLAIKGILTPEQQKKLRAFRSRRARARFGRELSSRPWPGRPMRPKAPPAPPAPEPPPVR